MGIEMGAYWEEGWKFFVWTVLLLANAESQGMQVSFGKYFLQISLTNPFSNKVFRSWIEFLVRERNRTSALLSGNGSYLNK